jgi:spermidine/putrescine transport system permease protein
MKKSRISFLKLIMPSFVGGVYFFLYLPIFILVLFSFNNAQMVYKWHGFTLHWYYELFRTTEIWTALKNSLIVASSAVTLSLVMGSLLVWGLNKKSKFFLPIFYVTVMIPDVVVAVGLLTFFTILYVPLGMTALIVGHTLIGLGFVVPIVYSRFADLDQRLIEASYDLGASQWQTFFKVILPLLKPSLISAGLLVFIISLDDFLIAFFCASSDSQTLSLYIFSMVRAGLSPLVNALSVFMLIVSSVFVLLFIALQNKMGGVHQDD